MKQTIPQHLKPTVNAFIATANRHGLTFLSVILNIGYTQEGKEGIQFEIDTPGGLTDEQARRIFGPFIDKHPTCGINYSRPPEPTALEKALYRASDCVLTVLEAGVKLKPVH